MQLFKIERDGFTQSLLSMYLSCPKKYSYAIQGLTTEKITTVLGSVGHDCLDALHSKKDWKKSLFNYKYEKHVPNNIKECAKAVLQHIIPAYAEYWCLDRSIKFKCEQIFDVKIGEMRIRGKVDAERSDNYLLESKFKTRISEEKISLRLINDLQSLFYILACRAQGKKFAGVIYDIIRLPQWNEKSKPNTLSEKVKTELKQDPSRYFFRFKTDYTDTELNVFQTELEHYYTKMCGRFHMRNLTACSEPYTCDYLNLCIHGDKKGLVKKPMFSELNTSKVLP